MPSPDKVARLTEQIRATQTYLESVEADLTRALEQVEQLGIARATARQRVSDLMNALDREVESRAGG